MSGASLSRQLILILLAMRSIVSTKKGRNVQMYSKWHAMQEQLMTVRKLQDKKLLAQLPGQLDIVYRCLCWSTVLHNIMKWNMYSQFQLLLAYHPQTSWSPCTVMQPGLLQPIYIASLCSREWTRALSERFFQRKAILFWQTCPKVKFAVSSYFYSTKKLLVLLVGPLFLKNRSDRARRVVNWSPCWMFHASLCTIQSKKFCGDFHF